MSIKNFFAEKFKITGKKGVENFDHTEFCRVIDIKERVQDESGNEKTVTRRISKMITSVSGGHKNLITLVPMRSLSIEDFTFPFSASTKIREALKLQVMPFSAAGELEIFPVVLSKEGKGVNGIVWYVSPEELGVIDDAYNPSGFGKIWPAPLPFISKLSKYNGSGVTMWLDEENICSMLWQNNRPVLSRWRKFVDETSEHKELTWYDEYCKAKEFDRGGNFVVNATGDTEDYEVDDIFREIITESVEICPWIADVNLSRSAVEGARDLERTLRLLTRASIWVLGIGLLFLGANFLRLLQLDNQVQQFRTRSENFYRQTFDPSHTGRIANPVTLARDKIAEASGTGGEVHSLEEVMADMGEIFAADKNMNITIDIVRYNNEGIDCTGVAPDMSTILNFRKLWENKVSLAQVDNTQFVSGIGYRFDLRVRW